MTTRSGVSYLGFAITSIGGTFNGQQISGLHGQSGAYAINNSTQEYQDNAIFIDNTQGDQGVADDYQNTTNSLSGIDSNGIAFSLANGNIINIFNYHQALNYDTSSASNQSLNTLTPMTLQSTDYETVACFCAGTRIRTATGEVQVEDLAIGDILVTADGQTRPVKWIGRHTVAAAFAHPVRAYPVRVAAGAIAEGVPARDLYLSPDHALLIDGVLVQAGALLNGSTVTRVEAPEPIFTYYHVETDDHAIVLADGTPAETFVSNVSRQGFDNYAEYAALNGARADFEAMPDRDEPRAMSRRQVPAGIRERMAERAVALMLMAPAAA